MRLQTPAEHCPPFSPYKKEAVWMHDLSVGSFAQTRQPAKRCYRLSSSTAIPGLAVKAGHLNNCASSCQMAQPALCFYRAINQSPREKRRPVTVRSHSAKTQTQSPGPLQGSVWFADGARTQEERQMQWPHWLLRNRHDLGKPQLWLLPLPCKNGLVADAFPASF